MIRRVLQVVGLVAFLYCAVVWSSRHKVTPVHKPAVPIISMPKTLRIPVIKTVDAKSLRCMTDVIFYEAAEEPYEGKLAVGTVVMNRVKSKGWPKTVCGVVMQRGKRGCQFSWVCGSRRGRSVALYNRAQRVAREVLAGKRLKAVGSATFFHNPSVVPSWAADFRHVATIGNHLFYAVR